MTQWKRLAVGLTLLLLLFAGSPKQDAHAYFEQGDLNGDGRVSAADASCLLRALRNPGEMNAEMRLRADMTQSGTVNKVDARVILSMAAGKIPDLVAFVSAISAGLCDEALFDQFCYTGAIQNGYDYRDERISITVRTQEHENAVCYIADIYIQDVALLRTAFSSGKIGGRLQTTDVMASRVGARIAINGDYYSAQRKGPIVRNGIWHRNSITPAADIAVLSWDGTFHTFSTKTLSNAALLALNPYQTWVFGPRLLNDNGDAYTQFNSRLSGKNPRTAIGYFAPGHYCFLVADGRQKGYSSGLSFQQLATLMHELGCTAAYNLDGGQTSMMATADALINAPYRGGRPVSDIIYIATGAEQ